MQDTPTVGLIGLGLMGTAIARRLLGAGFSVLGFDIDAGKRRKFVELGGVEARSVAEIASSCRIVALAVFTTDQVEQVVEGAGGLLGAATRIAICTSTCDPDRVGALATRVAPRGLALLEVPVSGTSTQVERGDGVGLVAGEEAAAQEADSVLAALCPQRYFLGAPGNGGRAKLAINLILGLNRAAIAEGLAFAERLGLDRSHFLDVAKGSAAYSQVMDVKGELWANDRFEPPMSRVDQSLKDFLLMLEMGKRVGMELPFAALYAELMGDCVAHDEAPLDNAIIINAIRRRAQ
jgi:3-hydroxyisobutyrate dehydrogenase-like beta-hydroxyacid dehydrogenase